MNRRYFFCLTIICATLAVAGAVQAKPGDLDEAYGSGGKAFVSFGAGTSSEAYDAALDGLSDKIVLAGYVQNPTYGSTHIALARFNSSGRLDTTFGASGKVDQSFGYLQIWANAIARQSDGKFVVAGLAIGQGAFAARFNSNGSVDSTFGSGGIKILPGSDAFDVVIQSDGKIVVSLSIGTFRITRLNTNGSIDTNFGVNGITNEDFYGYSAHGYALALQPDGKIIVCGVAQTDGTGADSVWAITRLLTYGWVDFYNFGTYGKLTYNWSTTVDFATTCTVQADGKIVVAGAVNYNNADFGLARFTSSGVDEFAVVDSFSNYDREEPSKVRVATNGRILVAGVVKNFAENDPQFAITCHLSNGALDTSFGVSGKVITDMSAQTPDTDWLSSMNLQKDGKIIVIGTAYGSDGKLRFASARYLGCGV